MIISRDNFKKYITEYREIGDIYNKICDAGKKLEFFDLYPVEYEDLIIEILQDAFDDKINDWIGYFIFELKYGEKYEDGMITDENDNNISLKNLDDLYDLLIDNMKEI